MTSAANPAICQHMLGQMMLVGGVDHILWGTDSIWNGSPQSQIERLRRLKMPDEFRKKYGYPDLTDEVKNQILGLNAAKVFGIDVKAKRQAIKADKLARLREEYREEPDAEQHAVRLGLGRRRPGADGAGQRIAR